MEDILLVFMILGACTCLCVLVFIFSGKPMKYKKPKMEDVEPVDVTIFEANSLQIKKTKNAVEVGKKIARTAKTVKERTDKVDTRMQAVTDAFVNTAGKTKEQIEAEQGFLKNNL